MSIFRFRRNQDKSEPPAQSQDVETDSITTGDSESQSPPPVSAAPISDAQVTESGKGPLLGRLRDRLLRTQRNLVDGLADLFAVERRVDDRVLEELETRLLMADVGVDATQTIIGRLAESVARRQLADLQALLQALRNEMLQILQPVSKPMKVDLSAPPYVVLMVGVNGVGKTTTIGKLARRLLDQGQSVLLAAGDTFRAAAVEQLQEWGRRNGVTVISQGQGADSASVIYDAVQAGIARGVDVVIADTAGRLHTKANLMEELRKIQRVVAKLHPGAPQEVMLVVDASTGQNALVQAVQFNETIPLTGITLTKLDGTAKGGIIFAISRRLNVPIRYIGVGEAVEDLRPFDAPEFVTALLDTSPPGSTR
jgi:fused signal recognition particle receptor